MSGERCNHGVDRASRCWECDAEREVGKAINSQQATIKALQSHIEDCHKLLDLFQVDRTSQEGMTFTLQHRIAVLNDESQREIGDRRRRAENADAKYRDHMRRAGEKHETIRKELVQVRAELEDMKICIPQKNARIRTLENDYLDARMVLREARNWGINSKGYDASRSRATTENADKILDGRQ